MASNRIKGITIEIEGNTTKLTDSLKSVDKSLKNTESELKDVNKLLKLDPNNTQLLQQKQELLSKAVAETKDKLKQEKDALEQLKNADPSSENAKQQDLLQREIIETEQSLESLEKEYTQFGSVAKQQSEIAASKMQEVGNKMSDIGGKMTTTVTLPIVAGFTAASSVASDYEENLNKLQVAFGDYADEVQDFTDSASADYGLSKVDASSYASSFGALAKGIGLTGGEASELSIELTKLSADLGSYFNTDLETSAKALEGIFTGESEALKKFGVVMNDTNLKDFANGLGLVYEELTQQEKVMLRYQYVMEKTADAQGDFSRTSDGTANSIKTFQAAVKDLATVIGSKLLPIITPIIKKVSDWVQRLSELNPKTVDLAVKVALVVAAIGPLLVIVGKIITTFGTLIKTVNTIKTAWTTLSTAFTAFSGPVGIVIAAIAALVAIGITLYKNWDTIKAKAQELGQNIANAWNNVKAKTSEAWNNVSSTVSSAVSRVKENAVNGFNNVRDSISNAFNNVRSTVSSIFSGIHSTISNVVGNIKSVFSSVTYALTHPFETARNTIQGIVDRIKGIFNFQWSLPHIKLPHFSVTTGFLGLPKISVSWYAKAMKNGMILNNPTIFGAMGGQLLGGGEAGSETVVGTNSLMSMIQQAVGNRPIINMTVNANGMNADELSSIVVDKITRQITRTNQRW